MILLVLLVTAETPLRDLCWSVDPSLKTLQSGKNITRLFFFTLPVTVHFIIASASRFQTSQLAISCILCGVSFFWCRRCCFTHFLFSLSLSLSRSLHQDHPGRSHRSLHRRVRSSQRPLLQGGVDDHLRPQRHHLPEGQSGVSPRTLQNFRVV